MVREYWRRVRSRAWKDTLAAFGLTTRQRTVVRLVLATAGIVAAVYFAPADNVGAKVSNGLAVTGVYLIVFIAIYLWNFARVPAVFDDEANKKIEQLTGQFEQRPKLKLTFDRSDPACIGAYNPRTGRGKHVHIFAQVDASSAVECRVELSNIELANENCEYKPAPHYHRTVHHLAWANITNWTEKVKPTRLSPGVPHLLDLTSTSQGEFSAQGFAGPDAFRLWIDPGHVPNLIWFAQPGIYRLTIRMTAEVPSVPDELTSYVIWNGDLDKLDVVNIDPCGAKREPETAANDSARSA